VVAHLFLECGLHDRLRQAREQATPADQLHTLGTRMVDQFLSKLLLVNVSRPWARSSRSVLVLSAKQRSACPGQLHRSPDSASESFQASVSVSKRKMYGGILRVMGLRISRRLSWVIQAGLFPALLVGGPAVAVRDGQSARLVGRKTRCGKPCRCASAERWDGAAVTASQAVVMSARYL
jgi:hypothetical protein